MVDGQLGGFRALENLVHIDYGVLIVLGQIRAVSDESTVFDMLDKRCYGRHAVL